jgi:DNA-binding NarL/FixJ family response regulator
MANEESIDSAVRVAVVDDDESIHLFLNDILQPTKTFILVGSFSSAAQALNNLPPLRPDLTLMDVRLPDLNGIECTKRLKQSMPHLKIVIVTGTHEMNWGSASREAGAEAYLVKPFDREQLLATLRFVSSGQINIKTDLPAKGRGVVRIKAVKIVLLLTPREKEVLRNLADGLLYKEISDKIGISYSAVHKYVDHIYRKLDVNNRSEAIRIWIDSGCD